MAVNLKASYARCRAITRAAGTSFAAGMKLFPKDRQDAVYALYAFFRHTDDIVDDPGPDDGKRVVLEAWREQVAGALAGTALAEDDPLLALADTARRFELPWALFEACIAACRDDIGPVRIPDWEALEHYCDGVAGTVGEACCRVLGYADETTLDLSIHNARGVQLTNILRDVDEDLQRDRIYLPAERLAAHGISEDGLLPLSQPAVQTVLGEVAERARFHFRRSDGLFWLLRPGDRPGMTAMTLRYRRILAQLLADGFDSRVRKMTAGQALALMCSAQCSRWRPTWRGPL